MRLRVAYGKVKTWLFSITFSLIYSAKPSPRDSLFVSFTSGRC